MTFPPLPIDQYCLDHVRRERLDGLHIQVRVRLEQTILHLFKHGALNRATIMAIGEVSRPQASADIAILMERFPGLIRYDSSGKSYVIGDS